MKRRIIAVLAAAALIFTVGVGASPATADVQDGADYVALGDSIASGNGNLPYLDADCLRSTRSYPMVLADILGTTVDSAACTEASTTDVAVEQLGSLGQDTELVTLTVGVNNVQLDEDPAPDWGDVLGVCSNSGAPQYCESLIQGVVGMMQATLPDQIANLIGLIRDEAPTAQIVITGYPLLFGDVDGTCNVGRGISFGEAQTEYINAAVLAVNGFIQQGVALSGDGNIIYVGVVDGFLGHGLCDVGDRWISGLISPNAKTTDRGFHPNAAGQRAYADIIAADPRLETAP